MTAVLTEPAPPGPGLDDDIIHAVCPQCFPDPTAGCVAICGAKGSFDALDAIDFENPPIEQLCVVCLDLFPAGCQRCGLRP